MCNNNRVQRSVSPAVAVRSEEFVDAVLAASRALVAVAARSLAAVDGDITLPQYRALVVMASRGPQRVAELATALNVEPSTATRMAERLVRKRLVRRRGDATDRRVVWLELTPSGVAAVGAVTGRRRAEIAELLAKVPTEARRGIVEAMRRLAAAAGESPEQDWAIGWDL